MGVPAILTGREPFPDLEGWRADAALCARQNLRGRESADPYCRMVVDRIDGLPAAEWSAVLLSPEVFAFLVDEPAQWDWRRLHRALVDRAARQDSGPVQRRPREEFTEILRNQGAGSRRHSSAAASFLQPGSGRFRRYEAAVDDALRLVDEVAPGYAADIAATVDCIALVDEEASFRGASGLGFRGMVMLSPDDSWTTGVFAEEIVHESTHCLLDLISLRQPLLSGPEAFEARWDAPFRPDPRPLFGNFHALVVVARLIHLFAVFERSRVADELDWAARATDYARRSESALLAVAEYAEMSPVARRFVDLLVSPTINGVKSCVPSG